MAEQYYPAKPVLIVDDEPAALSGAELILESDGITHLHGLTDSREVMRFLKRQIPSLVLLDLSMPHISGQTLLQQIIEQFPQVPVIIITGHNEVDIAIDCMKCGAFDYLTKPVSSARLSSAVRRAIELNELRSEYASFKTRILSNRLEHPQAFSHIITNNAKMHLLFHYVETIATSPRPVLITGETGVGKELMAQALHQLSGRSGRFVAVNAAGLDDQLFSDTLFGHVKGAFSDAVESRRGLIEQATGGTLFLDEIGDLDSSSQIKLLRLLQENEYYPLGADAAKPAETRVVVATNLSLTDLQTSSRFRSDLYFRLQTHHIHIPPLRERLDDISLLLDHFLEKAAAALNKPKPTPPRELTLLLASFHFPGNIRELEGMVFDAVSHHRDKMLSMHTFKEHIEKHRDGYQHTDLSLPDKRTNGQSPFALFEKLPTLAEAQILLIEEALQRAEGNHGVAAQLLGITRSGLSKAIKRKGIRSDRDRS